MKCRVAILIFLFTLIASCNQSVVDAVPNILIVVTDDLGFSDLSSYGGEIPTPNIDALCKGGVKFTQAYNSAKCAPSRAALLTGYFPQEIGYDDIPGKNIEPIEPLFFSEYITEKYRCIVSGKWHLKGRPESKGFDKSYVIKDRQRHFGPQKELLNGRIIEREHQDFYSSIEVTDRLIDFLKQENDEPFFGMLNFTAPHYPLQALPEDIARFKETYKVGWDSIRNRRYRSIRNLSLVPGFLPDVIPNATWVIPDLNVAEEIDSSEMLFALPWDSLTIAQQRFQAEKMSIHAAMVYRIDQEFGRLIKHLKESGEWENTIIIFTSDNGACSEIKNNFDLHHINSVPGTKESYLCLGTGWSTVSNTPFKYHKTWVYNGGVACPFIVSTPQSRATGQDRVINEAIHFVDVAPTILELTGHEIPKDLSGTSFLPLLKGQDTLEIRPPIYWRHLTTTAIYNDDYKAIRFIDKDWELYNMKTDRTETIDLSGKRPEILKGLIDKHRKIENGLVN